MQCHDPHGSPVVAALVYMLVCMLYCMHVMAASMGDVCLVRRYCRPSSGGNIEPIERLEALSGPHIPLGFGQGANPRHNFVFVCRQARLPLAISLVLRHLPTARVTASMSRASHCPAPAAGTPDGHMGAGAHQTCLDT